MWSFSSVNIAEGSSREGKKNIEGKRPNSGSL